MRRQPGEWQQRNIPENSVRNQNGKTEPGQPDFISKRRTKSQQRKERKRQHHQRIHGQRTGQISVKKPVQRAKRAAAGTVKAGQRMNRTGRDPFHSSRIKQKQNRHCGQKCSARNGVWKMPRRSQRPSARVAAAMTTRKSRRTIPIPNAHQHHIFALREASLAPVTSPA